MVTVRDFISGRARAIEIQPQTSIDTTGLINLSSGTPDFTPPSFVIDSMIESLRNHKLQYTAWAGMSDLRRAIALKLNRENGMVVDPESEVLVTAGAQEALMTVLLTLLDPGDEVLISDPHYPVYTRAATIAGGKVVTIPTTLDTNFVPIPEDVEAAITKATKAIILVSPNNPTGTVFPRETLESIVAIASKHNVLIISDEIYEHYVFGGHEHTSVATLPGAKHRTITINSLSKGYALTGIRVGYVVAPSHFINAMLPFHHCMTICAPITAQYGAIAALTASREWFVPILAEYDRRRQLWIQVLDEVGLPYGEPRGAYYVFFDIRPLGLDEKVFIKRAREEAGLTLGSGGSGFIRGSLMQASPRLEEGLDRLQKLVRKLC